MSGGGKKAWRVVKYLAAMDLYEIEYCKDGVRQSFFRGRRDNRNGLFRLIYAGRVPYGDVPKKKTVYFDECDWEI